VRLLFTFCGGEGHLRPLLPLAAAAAAAGHAVIVTGAASLARVVRSAGLGFVPSGPDVTPNHRPLQLVDLENERRIVGDYFAGRLARARATDLIDLCTGQRPDLIVRDEMDFGAAVAAERLGIPHASVVVIAAGGFVRPELVAGPLDRLRDEVGLGPDPGLAMLTRFLVLSPVPARFRDPADPLPTTTRYVRAPQAIGAPARIPAIDRLAGSSAIYVTLGTIFNTESGDLFGRVLAGLAQTGAEVVVTVGRGVDPAELGPQPERIHVEPYLPQALLLPHCAAVVSHAGSGSVLGALQHGLPVLCLPLGADQPLNASRCVALGVGRQLDVATLTPDDVVAALHALLTEPSYRRAAEQFQVEMAAHPSVADALKRMELLAARGS